MTHTEAANPLVYQCSHLSVSGSLSAEDWMLALLAPFSYGTGQILSTVANLLAHSIVQ